MTESTDKFIYFLDPYINRFLDYLPIKVADSLASLHPYIVMFAVSLPLVAIIFEMTKKDYLVKSGKILHYSSIILIFLAFLSGKSAYTDAYNNIPYDGLNLLNSHTTIGMIIFLSYVVIVFLTLLLYMLKKDKINSFILFLISLNGIFILYMIYSGVKLVFHFGAGIIL